MGDNAWSCLDRSSMATDNKMKGKLIIEEESDSRQMSCNNNEISFISSAADILEDAIRRSDVAADAIMGDADASTSEKSNGGESSNGSGSDMKDGDTGNVNRISLKEGSGDSDWSQYKCREDIVGRYGRVSFYDFTGTPSPDTFMFLSIF